jgi:hypothetical protein
MSKSGLGFRFSLRFGIVLLAVLVIPAALMHVNTFKTKQDTNPGRSFSEALLASGADLDGRLTTALATVAHSLPDDAGTLVPAAWLSSLLRGNPELSGASWHAQDGRLIAHEQRGTPAAPAFYERFDPVALPTLHPALSPPYSPPAGRLAVAVLVPVHPRPGPVLGFVSLELDLSLAWEKVVGVAELRRGLVTLLDQHGRHILGAQAPRDLRARASRQAATALGETSIQADAQADGLEECVVFPLKTLGWSLLFRARSRDPQAPGSLSASDVQ